MKIETVEISKKYGPSIALEDVSFCSKTTILGVIGPNGAGKTTLFNIITNLIEPDSGQVLLDDVPIHQAGEEVKNNIGYFPQDFTMYGELSCQEILEFFCALKGVSNKKDEISRIIDLFDLEKLLKVRFSNMSKGMKQKTGLAATLINDPDLIIVDEPTSGLDPAERIRFRNLISRLSVRKTIIFSTHIISDIESICENLLVLKKGRIMFMGRTADLLSEHAGMIFESEISGDSCDRIDRKYMVLKNTSRGNGLFHSVILSESPVSEFGFTNKLNVTLEEAYLSLIVKNE